MSGEPGGLADLLPREAGSAQVANRSSPELSRLVYRLYDQDDRLLYVGQSQVLTHRIGFHRRDPRFGTQIHHVRYQQVPTFREMCDLEAALIIELQPPHNTAGLGQPAPDRGRPPRPEIQTDPLPIQQAPLDLIKRDHQRALARLSTKR